MSSTTKEETKNSPTSFEEKNPKSPASPDQLQQSKKTLASTTTQEKPVIRYAQTEHNCKALGKGGLSAKSARLLMKSQKLRDWKDNAKSVVAQGGETKQDSLMGSRVKTQMYASGKNPSGEDSTDDNEGTTTVNMTRSKSAGMYDLNATGGSSSSALGRSTLRRSRSTLASRVLSWPVVLDRVIAKKRSAEDAEARRSSRANSRVNSANNTGRHSEGPQNSEGQIDDFCGDDDDEMEEELEYSFRRECLRVILGWKFEVMLLVLLAMDVILLIIELELRTRLVCHISWDHTAHDVHVPAGHPFLASPSTIKCHEAPHIEYSCAHGRTFSLPQNYSVCPFHVEEELPHNIHTAEVVINWFSRAIIGVFAIEILTLIACSGISILWRHKMYMLDFIVIFLSIVLEVLASTIDIDRASEIIVVARIWRFARIIHGVGVSVHDVDEHEMVDDEEEYVEEKEEIVEEFFPDSSPMLKEKRKKELGDKLKDAKAEAKAEGLAEAKKEVKDNKKEADQKEKE